MFLSLCILDLKKSSHAKIIKYGSLIVDNHALIVDNHALIVDRLLLIIM